jgi:hypothetical protein
MVPLGKWEKTLGSPLVKQAIGSLDDVHPTGSNHAIGVIWAVVTDRDPKRADFALLAQGDTDSYDCDIDLR